MIIYSGDIVYCRVRGTTLVAGNKWDGIIHFEVIGISPDDFYILHVPSYYNIKHSWKLEEDQRIECNIEKSYVGTKVVAIASDKICKIIRQTPIAQSGMPCIKCTKFCYMAEPNQDDGTFKCYSCRH